MGKIIKTGRDGHKIKKSYVLFFHNFCQKFDKNIKYIELNMYQIISIKFSSIQEERNSFSVKSFLNYNTFYIQWSEEYSFKQVQQKFTKIKQK